MNNTGIIYVGDIMKVFKRFWTILKRTGALKIFLNFIVVCIIAAFILKQVEPGIKTVKDGLWYSYISATTIGFGDFYATTPLGRIITVFISFNGILVFAMMTGVVVSYYNEYLNSKTKESRALFLEKLENLPNLSKEELEEISKQVKKMK